MLNLNWPWHIAHKCQKCSIPQVIPLSSLWDTSAEATSLPLYCKVLFRNDHDVHALARMGRLWEPRNNMNNIVSVNVLDWKETSLLQACFLICNFRVLRLTKSALDSKFGSTQVFDRMRRDTFDERWSAGLSDRLVRMLQLICQKWRANMLASENFVEARMRKR